MRKIEVAVCETEEEYRSRFVAYLVEHKSGEASVHAFSAQEHFLGALEQRSFDIAVFGGGFEQAEEYAGERSLPVIRLKNTVPEQVAETGCYQTDSETAVTEVFRYQPMEAIWHEMQALTGGGRTREASQNIAMKMEVIGVCSPVRHEMQMPFSLTCAGILAEKSKVLYLNLMEYSGFLEVFQLEGSNDLGDIIVKLRSGRLLPEAFGRYVYESEGVSYIPPFGNPENLHELTLEDYQTLLAFLEQQTDFETVVIDFGEGLDRFGRMLQACSSIFCLTKQGFYFNCQVEHFMDYIKSASENHLRERLQLIELPFSARHLRAGNGMGILRQLLWSEFGDYVRKRLTGAVYESK